MNNNEHEQFSAAQEQEKIMKTETPESAKPELAEGLEKDPRIDSIKQEFTSNWESAHPGKKYDERGVLSGEYQDFLFGDPRDFKLGKEPISLEKRAGRVFAERFPDDAKAYAEKEKARAYENPADDPAIKAIETDITRITNKDAGEEMGREKTTGEASGRVWDKNFNRVYRQQWENFLTSYPEKAAAYREKFEPIQKAFEREERWQRIQAEREAEARLGEQSQRETLPERPSAANVETDEKSERGEGRGVEIGENNPDMADEFAVRTKPSQAEQSFTRKIDDFSRVEEIGRELGKHPEEQPEENQGKDFFSMLSSFREPHRFEIDSGRITQRIIEIQPREKSFIITESGYSGNPRRWEIFGDGRVTLEETNDREVDVPAGQSMMKQRTPETSTKRGREALAELKKLLAKFAVGVKEREIKS
jgi:hypothetical protein